MPPDEAAARAPHGAPPTTPASADPPVPVLLLSGTVGVGKTTVLTEMHTLLAEQDIPHACVEIDALACSWPERGRFNEDTALRNLAAVWANFREAGAERLIIAGVVERAADLAGYRRAVPGAQITVCRLTAPEGTRLARLRARERGAGLAWHLRRTVELECILESARLEDFVVVNDERSPLDVAREVLTRAGWLGTPKG